MVMESLLRNFSFLGYVEKMLLGSKNHKKSLKKKKKSPYKKSAIKINYDNN